jgi:hypothetical protein
VHSQAIINDGQAREQHANRVPLQEAVSDPPPARQQRQQQHPLTSRPLSAADASATAHTVSAAEAPEQTSRALVLPELIASVAPSTQPPLPPLSQPAPRPPESALLAHHLPARPAPAHPHSLPAMVTPSSPNRHPAPSLPQTGPTSSTPLAGPVMHVKEPMGISPLPSAPNGYAGTPSPLPVTASPQDSKRAAEQANGAHLASRSLDLRSTHITLRPRQVSAPPPVHAAAASAPQTPLRAGPRTGVVAQSPGKLTVPPSPMLAGRGQQPGLEHHLAAITQILDHVCTAPDGSVPPLSARAADFLSRLQQQLDRLQPHARPEHGGVGGPPLAGRASPEKARANANGKPDTASEMKTPSAAKNQGCNGNVESCDTDGG